jgi:hypothetical protein
MNKLLVAIFDSEAVANARGAKLEQAWNLTKDALTA